MQLLYTTRGDSSPRGKAKIFLLCLPEDFSKYFEPIVSDIFETQNCSVWYTKDKTIDKESAFEFLQMQLLVVPITRNVLGTDNYIIDFALPFATENKIPVLPILVEPGLDLMFGQKCGALQYLDKTAVDSTAISYQQKLASFLNSVLLNDTIIDQVKDAFDAYIFLSYRKKDRAYAQELMHLIHNNDFCESVAIWYDEFLVPGENFNEAIYSAIKNSSLFSLMVTPNVVSEKNYIAEVEYPLARENNKRILPLEMVETGAGEIQQVYPNIPKPVDARDSEKLAQSLKDYLPIALEENTKHPIQHDFFVGLAYLSGIDVEVDRERAFKLISSAADAGLEQAMKKLSHMYLNGDGVANSNELAILWQKKLVNKLGYLAEESRSEKDAMVYLRENMLLGDMACSAEDYDTAEDAFSKSYELAKILSFGALSKTTVGKVKVFLKKYVRNQGYHEEAIKYMAKAARKMTEIFRELAIGDEFSKWAMKAQLFAVNVVNKLYEDSESAVEVFALSSIMSLECTESGNLTGSKLWLDTAEKCWSRLYEDERTSGVKYAFSFMYDAAYKYELANNNIREAFDCLKNKIELLQELSAEFPDIFDYRYEIIAATIHQADMLLQSDCTKALVCINTAGDMLDGEENKNGNIKIQLLYTEYYFVKGKLDFSANNCSYSIASLKKGYEIIAPICDIMAKADHLEKSALICENIGDAYFYLADYKEADVWYRKAQDFVNGLNVGSALVKYVRQQAGLFDKLLDNAIKSENRAAICEWNDKALWVRDGLVKGVVLKRNGLQREKKVSNLIEKGKVKSVQFINDGEALKKLQDKQPLISDLKKTLQSPYEGSLHEYVRSSESRNNGADIKTINHNIMLLIDDYRSSHLAARKELAQDLVDLKNYLFVTLPNNDLIQEIAVKQEVIDMAMRACDHIEEYMLKHMIPFVKYDEQSLLLLSYSSFLFIRTAQKMGYDKNETIKSYLRFYKSIIFWDYPVEKVRYKKLWGLIYNWLREETPFWIFVGDQEF